MIGTPLGTIDVYYNGINHIYKYVALKNTCKVYRVDKRYHITVPIISNYDDNIIECKLIKNKIDILDDISSQKDSGQNLESICFNNKNVQLHIGVRGEIPHVKYDYLEDGIKVTIPKQANVNKIVFGIAWLTMRDKELESNFTWFAADPTYYTGSDWLDSVPD